MVDTIQLLSGWVIRLINSRYITHRVRSERWLLVLIQFRMLVLIQSIVQCRSGKFYNTSLLFVTSCGSSACISVLQFYRVGGPSTLQSRVGWSWKKLKNTTRLPWVGRDGNTLRALRSLKSQVKKVKVKKYRQSSGEEGRTHRGLRWPAILFKSYNSCPPTSTQGHCKKKKAQKLDKIRELVCLKPG